MRTCSLTHLSDAVLARDLRAAAAGERASTAVLLAHLAEFDKRRLYLGAGYPSMFHYCVEELHLSEDSALKRIQAARVARKFPAILPALAEGRLHLSAVVLLAPHLTAANAGDLLATAAHRSKTQIAALIAERFPRSEVLPLVVAISAGAQTSGEHAPGHVEVGPRGTPQNAPGHVASPKPRTQVAPVAPERYVLQATIGKDTYEKLRYAEALISHSISPGDLAALLDRLLDLGLGQLEKRRFCATRRPRAERHRPSADPRHIPAHVKRAVWERDGGRCTYVSEDGHRCSAREFLQFDHVEPVARGGGATVAGLRLLCRAHNQFEAQRVFGADYMKAKRDAAQRARAAARDKEAAAAEAAVAETQACAPAEEVTEDVIACLRTLRFRAEQARRAAKHCATLPDVTLEERVRSALRFLCPKRGVTPSTGAGVSGSGRARALEVALGPPATPGGVATVPA